MNHQIMNDVLKGPKINTKNQATKPSFGWSIFALLLFLFAFSVPASSSAAALPEPTAELYVLDQAGVMSNETSSMIINTSKELARLTKAQVAVVTLKTLDGRPLEEVSLDILRKWQLGDKKLNNGVLILLVPDEHLSRIEVGYGLEGVLTDGKTGRIQDDYMLPYFKEGNYDKGLRDGYLAIIQEVAGEYNVNINVDSVQKAPGRTSTESEKETPAWMIVVTILVVLLLAWLDFRYLNGFIFGFLLGTLFRGGRGGGGFGGGGSMGGGGSGGGGGSSRGW